MSRITYCRGRMFASVLWVTFFCVLSLSTQAGTLLKAGPGTHTFVSPATGDYKITIGGGWPGATHGHGPSAGAEVSGIFNLPAGTSITAVVAASHAPANSTFAPGAAGSFVYIPALSPVNSLLLAAGGGGGGSSAIGSGFPGSLVNSPLSEAGGMVAGINGGNGRCCGTTSLLGGGGQSFVAGTHVFYVGGSSLITSTNTQGFVRITQPPFQVGGTISGLGAAGLVLQNNSGDNQTIASGGTSFAFTPLPEGSNYSVSVLSQPLGHNCTVSNGTGTINDDDVSNVSVSCTPIMYSVGGTISGVAGIGGTLLNNGGNAQTIANGTFNFNAQNYDTAYAVTVGAQPSGLSQTCTVTNGSGTLPASNVSNVSVACTTKTFTVSGTVSGLSGSGLTLLYNGGGSQAVTADGPFAFTAQADGTGYDVTVASQPSSPAQTCAITSGSGTLTGSNVTGVAVQCTNDPVRTFSGVSSSGSPVVLSFTTTDPTCTFSANPQFTAATAPPAGLVFPHGVASFIVDLCSNGVSINVTLDYGTTLPPGAVAYKSSPWTQVAGASISGSVISYTVFDGGPLDTDGMVNGVIVDPIGAGVAVASSSGSANAVPVVPVGGLVLMTLLLGYIGNRKFNK